MPVKLQYDFMGRLLSITAFGITAVRCIGAMCLDY
jgi:hypothetical protein